MKLVRYLTWEIRDKHGQLISYEKKECNSYVRSFIELIHTSMSQAAVASGSIDTGGTTRTMIDGAYTLMMANAPLGNTSYGIVVGTGSNAVAITDTALQTKIAHGNGAGQLAYGTMTFTNPSTSGSTRSFTLQRTFTNNSAGSITINEVGLYTSNQSYYYCSERTLSTKTINSGSTGTATYTLGVTV